MDRSHLALVIPAFNEEATIAAIVKKVSSIGTPIVVNDASLDRTAEEAKKSGGIVVTHKNNKGYDNALNTGFEKADELGCKYVITLDADGQHNPDLIGHIVEKFEQDYDLVLCVRNRLPRFSEKLFSMYSKLRFSISDPCCGLKGYSIDILKEKGVFDTYQSIGTELAFFGSRQGYKLIEMPFVVEDRLDTPRFGNSLKANFKIIKSLLNSIARY